MASTPATPHSRDDRMKDDEEEDMEAGDRNQVKCRHHQLIVGLPPTMLSYEFVGGLIVRKCPAVMTAHHFVRIFHSVLCSNSRSRRAASNVRVRGIFLCAASAPSTRMML